MSRNRLLALGLACLALGLGLGAFSVARGDSSPSTTPSATTILPSPTVTDAGAVPPITDPTAGPSPTDASGDPVTTLPGKPPGTATTIPGRPPASVPGGTITTVTAGASTPTTVPAPPADPKKQLAVTAAQAGFPLFVLDDPLWTLHAVRSATVGDHTIVDLSYAAGSDYLSISQESLVAQTDIPNSERVTIRGIPAELLDLGGVIVIRWNETTTSMAVSTSLKRDAALAAAEKIALYKG